MTRFRYLAPAAAIALFWAAGVRAGDDKPDAAADLKSMEGNWQFNQEEMRGNRRPKIILDNQRIVIEGGKISWYMGNPAPNQTADLKLDPTTNPKSIDALITLGSFKDKKMLGVYKLSKDTLEICWAEPGSDERPKKFTSEPGAGGGTVYALLVRPGASASKELAHAPEPISLAGVGGAVLLPDNQTLVVAVTPDATLLYLDTATEKEIKRAEVEFKPTALALQGDKLYAAAAGASAVHVLDAASGKELKSIKIPGEPVLSMACHPSKGLLYAANDNNEILAIDPDAGTANKTKAKGQMLAVDSADGKYVYAGVQKPIKDVLVFQRGPGGRTNVSLAQANERALMLKYAVKDQDLELEALNDNAAINGHGIALSPDGKLIAMAGGGGWESKTNPKRIYGVPVFDTTDMQNQSGLVETGAYPGGVAFHPVLNLGVAYHAGGVPELIIFSTKSFATKDTLKLPRGIADPAAHTEYLGFVAKGTKVAYVIGGNPVNSKGVVGFTAMNLKDEDQETLKKAYAK